MQFTAARVSSFGLSLAIATSALVRVASATELVAADPAQLTAAIAASYPGDTIVLANGTWQDAVIVLSRGGTASAPLRIRAKTPGGVVFTGGSSLTFAAPYLEVDGVLFKGGALAKGSVVQFSSDYDRLTNSAV